VAVFIFNKANYVLYGFLIRTLGPKTDILRLLSKYVSRAAYTVAFFVKNIGHRADTTIDLTDC
jgi:hypothetical protein